ncbi:alpha-hydroxy-acid oxidizing protein, partial [Proteus mirabilis]
MKHTLLKTTAIAMALSVGVVQAAEYKASTAEGPIKIVNLKAMEAQVEANMDKGAFGYIRGGAEDENNLRANTRAFDKKYIIPRSLQGIEFSDINLKTEFLGIKLDTPIIQAPMAAQGLAHQQGEVATAKGMAKAGSIFSLSTYGNKTIKEVAQAQPGYPFFFQLYMSKNDAFNQYI